jgi:hypothetical protein
METYNYSNINNVEWYDGFFQDVESSSLLSGCSVELQSYKNGEAVFQSQVSLSESQSAELTSLVNKWNTGSYQSMLDGYEVKIYDYIHQAQGEYVHDAHSHYEPPFEIDFRTGVDVSGSGRFEHSKILKKGDFGDFSEKDYFSTVTIDSASNKPVLSDMVLKRLYDYEYHHADRWVKKTETICWYKKDETVHPKTKKVVHYFDGQKYMRFMVEKRSEIIEFLKTWAEQSMGFNALYNSSSSLYQNSFADLDTKGKLFLGDFDDSIRKFIDGQPQTVTGSFVYNLTHDTGSHHWINDPVTPTVPNGNPSETMRELMISESMYPMS